MIEKNDLGNICHEHIEFYSIKSLKYLFENNGLEIFKIEEKKCKIKLLLLVYLTKSILNYY